MVTNEGSVEVDSSSSLEFAASDPQQASYLAGIARLRELQKTLPNVTDRFLLDVASMSREELQKRCLIGSDWIGSFHKCLDGIKEIRAIGGGGIEGCRGPREIQSIVRQLVSVCPLTFEKSSQGVSKS